jgi:DNA excision repair protein ERCC-2
LIYCLHAQYFNCQYRHREAHDGGGLRHRISFLVTMTTAYTVAVRSLCEFTAKSGDLDLRFTPSPSAQEGIAGHGVVTSRRAEHYESEVSLKGCFGALQVRGRADGYDPVANRIEEIKTHRGDLSRMPDNHRQLHWAQAKIYGWLLCQTRGLAEIEVALVYFDIATHEETLLAERYAAPELETFFNLHCARFLEWAQHELAHRAARDTALSCLSFPHPDFRTGQRPLAEAVYRAATSGRCLMAQAPTGIGKSVGTLFPALKAMPGQALDKLFFLTAKTSGRQAALDALRQIRAGASDAPPLRVIEIVARDKACEHPDKACHGDSCPLAAGFYDRLPQARASALAAVPAGASAALLDRAAVRATALAHDICPYYLTQELVRWADVVVADYNYYFDTTAMLFGLTLANDWRVGVLADEAHNLVERARRMYSATLEETALQTAQRSAPQVLRAPLAALAREWQRLEAPTDAAYTVLPTIPAAFRNALQTMIAATSELLAENQSDPRHPILDFYFDALHFSRLAESFEAHSLFDITTLGAADTPDAAHLPTPRRPGRTLCIRNIVPAPFLKGRFAAARSVTLFSATLGPQQFYRDMLGMPETTAWVDVPWPFEAQQLSVQVVDRISTRFNDRARSLLPIVDLMARQFGRQRGNYLAFFSSFDYLQQVEALFAERHPEIATWAQSRRMDEPARDGFLARFSQTGAGIGFAVLGGSFGEGIDLPGERLIGAFIATLGLPQQNPVNDQMMQRMESIFAAGYDYTYLYPGIQKVVQAAGRVIRTRTDRGVVFLIDDRFGRAEIRRLLPAWWDVRREQAPAETGSAGPARRVVVASTS